jgi:TRAP-type mannitol/chloroaromatic compound transport system substrate-binding protein
MMKKFSSFMLIILFLVALVIIVGCGNDKTDTVDSSSNNEVFPEKIYELKLGNYIPKGGVIWLAFDEYVDIVREASGGRIEIIHYGADEVAPVMESWDALADGILDMQITYPSYWAGKTSMADFSLGLPFTVQSIEQDHVLTYELGLIDVIREEYAKQNIHLLCNIPVCSVVAVLKEPISSVDDLNGMIIRSGGMIAEVMDEFGASTTLVPVSEVYGALDTGVVDGAITGGIWLAEMFSFHEVTDYILLPPITSVDHFEIQVNKEVWDELPDDLKKILETSAQELSNKLAARFAIECSRSLQSMIDDGMQVIRLSDEEYKKMQVIAHQFYEKKAEQDPVFAKGYEVIKEFMELEFAK